MVEVVELEEPGALLVGDLGRSVRRRFRRLRCRDLPAGQAHRAGRTRSGAGAGRRRGRGRGRCQDGRHRSDDGRRDDGPGRGGPLGGGPRRRLAGSARLERRRRARFGVGGDLDRSGGHRGHRRFGLGGRVGRLISDAACAVLDPAGNGCEERAARRAGQAPIGDGFAAVRAPDLAGRRHRSPRVHARRKRASLDGARRSRGIPVPRSAGGGPPERPPPMADRRHGPGRLAPRADGAGQDETPCPQHQECHQGEAGEEPRPWVGEGGADPGPGDRRGRGGGQDDEDERDRRRAVERGRAQGMADGVGDGAPEGPRDRWIAERHAPCRERAEDLADHPRGGDEDGRVRDVADDAPPDRRAGLARKRQLGIRRRHDPCRPEGQRDEERRECDEPHGQDSQGPPIRDGDRALPGDRLVARDVTDERELQGRGGQTATDDPGQDHAGPRDQQEHDAQRETPEHELDDGRAEGVGEPDRGRQDDDRDQEPDDPPADEECRPAPRSTSPGASA